MPRVKTVAKTVGKKSVKRSVFIVSLGVAILYSLIIIFINFFLAADVYGYNEPKKASAISLPAIFSRPVLVPTRLKIPSININVEIESIGLTTNGAIDVPIAAAKAGWFNLGPRPGAPGNAIIDGHFGRWKNGTQAIFNNLDKLQIGDKIYVDDEAGASTTFIVRALRQYHKDSTAAEVFKATDALSHLNLITCYGTWDTVKKVYSDRLVVFADKE